MAAGTPHLVESASDLHSTSRQIATNKQQVTRQQDLSQVIRLAVRLLNLPSDSHILQILSITLYQV